MWESTTDDVIDYFFICSTFTPPLTPSHRQPHTNNVGLERDQRHFSFASAIYLSKPFSKSRFLFVFKPVSTGGGLLSLSGWVDRVIEGRRERGGLCVWWERTVPSDHYAPDLVFHRIWAKHIPPLIIPVKTSFAYNLSKSELFASRKSGVEKHPKESIYTSIHK